MNGTTGNDGLIHIYDPDPNYISAITDSPTGKNLKIYPNPSKNVLNIEPTTIIPETSFTIKDELGQTVMQGIVNKAIDVSKLSQGIYFLTIGNETRLIAKE
jgi:hypothetical protein